ncbi:G3E family GTPase [Sinorhizobium terangae]|nr:G3E family GTPase [Sinorhizobium terangae]
MFGFHGLLRSSINDAFIDKPWPGVVQMLKPYLNPIWGDRRQKIVFIGADPMDEGKIRAELDACLIDSRVFAPELWRNLPDPFATWDRRAA